MRYLRMNATNYYLFRNNQTEGPFTIGQLRGMWNAGTITGNILCAPEGTDQWAPLAGLASQLEAPAPVAVIQAQPFADLTTPIPGRKKGKLTLLGKIGVGIGFMGVPMLFMEEVGKLGMFAILMGIGSYLWIRKPE